MNRNIAIALVIIILLGVGGYFLYTKVLSGGNLSAQAAAQKAIDFINKQAASDAEKVTLGGTPTEENGLYKFIVKYKGQDFTSYVTKDGKIFFQSGINIGDSSTQPTDQTQTTDQANQQTTQQAKPDVKLFVMSYCPYGLQAEKMYLPVYNLLKDKADMGIYFVYYAMHGKTEVDENLRQYCIQKNEKAKYAAYLACFVKAGDTNSCLTQANIDQTKLSVCVADSDKQFKVTADYNDRSTWVSGSYPKFEVNADLNTQYNVQGSPTLVINGKQVNLSARSPEKFKEAICNAFTTKPAECSQTLSTTAATPSFDSNAAPATNGGSCE